eukprot:gene3140-3973_t
MLACAGEKTKIELYVVFTRLMVPFPKKIDQADPQRVLYQDNHFFLTPYVTEQQITSVTLPSTLVESVSVEQPSSRTDYEITYGPYGEKPAFSESPMRLHFENNAPFARALTFTREIQVSHWGNVAIEETYLIQHDGAKHKGEFSRYDYQRNAKANGVSAFKKLLAVLPPRARSMYYRDEIGNISSSHVRHSDEKTEMDVLPRYPLFGGWKIDFMLGFSLPLPEVLSKTPEGRILNVSFGPSIQDLWADEVTVSVVLPEGSHSIESTVPFAVEESRGTKFSILDTVGRPVVVLKLRNLVPDHNKPFTVTYKSMPLGALRKPILLSMGSKVLKVMRVEKVLLISSSVGVLRYLRLDLTLAKDEHWQAAEDKERARDAMHSLERAYSARGAILKGLDTALLKLTRTRAVEACLTARAGVEAQLKATREEVKQITDTLELLGHKDIAKLRELERKHHEKQVQALQVCALKIDYVKKCVDPKVMDQKLRGGEEKLAAVRQEMAELLAAIDFS